MKKPSISRIRDSVSTQSRLGDRRLSLSEVLRTARHRKQLSQQGLAQKLGLRQRQISDLERAVTDSRLSTIQNVARTLDLELMLIPRHLLAVVEALQRAGVDVGKRPLYALENEDIEDVAAEARPVEVGDSRDIHSPPTRRARATKGPRR